VGLSICVPILLHWSLLWVVTQYKAWPSGQGSQPSLEVSTNWWKGLRYNDRLPKRGHCDGASAFRRENWPPTRLDTMLRSGPKIQSAGRRPVQKLRNFGPTALEFRPVDEVASPAYGLSGCPCMPPSHHGRRQQHAIMACQWRADEPQKSHGCKLLHQDCFDFVLNQYKIVVVGDTLLRQGSYAAKCLAIA
jgi:hypothetical protein